MLTMPNRICDIVTPWAKRLPDHLALVEAGGSWTYRQLDAAIVETQTCLSTLGIRPGDRVMIVGENCRAFVALLLAAASLDAWPVLANARLSAREIDEIREHSGARRVLYTASASTHAADHAARHCAAIEERNGLGTIGIGPLN